MLIDWQRKTLIAASTDDAEIDALYNEEKSILQRLENLHEYNALSSRIFRNHHRQGRPRTKEDLKKIEELAEHQLLREESTALSEEARARFYNIRAALAQARGDKHAYYENSKALISLLERNPSHKTEDLTRYVNMLHNFVDACNGIGNMDELYTTLDKLRSLPAECPSLEARIFSTVATMETSLGIRTGNLDGTFELLESVKADLARFEDKVSPGEVVILKFNLSLAYFILGKFRDALYWANEVVNSDENQVRKDMYCMGKIFCLIIHFELGNLDYLEYSVKSTYRFLSQRNQLYDFEKITLEFIRRLPRVQSQQSLVESFKGLYDGLIRISQENPLEQSALHTFEILSWLESKIEKVPLAEIIKKRAHKEELQLQAA